MVRRERQRQGMGSTYEADTCASFAEVVVATEEVEHGEMNTSEVVLRERFERRQVECQFAESIQHALHNIALGRRWRSCSEEGIQRSGLEASLLGDLEASEQGPPEGRISAGEEVGADNMEEE